MSVARKRVFTGAVLNLITDQTGIPASQISSVVHSCQPRKIGNGYYHKATINLADNMDGALHATSTVQLQKMLVWNQLTVAYPVAGRKYTHNVNEMASSAVVTTAPTAAPARNVVVDKAADVVMIPTMTADGVQQAVVVAKKIVLAVPVENCTAFTEYDKESFRTDAKIQITSRSSFTDSDIVRVDLECTPTVNVPAAETSGSVRGRAARAKEQTNYEMKTSVIFQNSTDIKLINATIDTVNVAIAAQSFAISYTVNSEPRVAKVTQIAVLEISTVILATATTTTTPDLLGDTGASGETKANSSIGGASLVGIVFVSIAGVVAVVWLHMWLLARKKKSNKVEPALHPMPAVSPRRTSTTIVVAEAGSTHVSTEMPPLPALFTPGASPLPPATDGNVPAAVRSVPEDNHAPVDTTAMFAALDNVLAAPIADDTALQKQGSV